MKMMQQLYYDEIYACIFIIRIIYTTIHLGHYNFFKESNLFFQQRRIWSNQKWLWRHHKRYIFQKYISQLFNIDNNQKCIL